jgi:ElaB/YqjD/DUF883 family membrane-anchored ribosome-binding protein
MDEKSKITIEDLHKTISEVKDYTENIGKELRDSIGIEEKELQETIKKKPLESAGVIFIAGIIIGLLIGSVSRH